MLRAAEWGQARAMPAAGRGTGLVTVILKVPNASPAAGCHRAAVVGDTVSAADIAPAKPHISERGNRPYSAPGSGGAASTLGSG